MTQRQPYIDFKSMNLNSSIMVDSRAWVWKVGCFRRVDGILQRRLPARKRQGYGRHAEALSEGFKQCLADGSPWHLTVSKASGKCCDRKREFLTALC